MDAVAIAYVVAWATLMRAVLVELGVLPRTCGRCGLRFERGYLGDVICSCGR